MANRSEQRRALQSEEQHRRRPPHQSWVDSGRRQRRWIVSGCAKRCAEAQADAKELSFGVTRKVAEID